MQGLEIPYYLWTPDKEQTHDPSGWKLPDDYYGVSDQRIYSYPVVYNSPTTGSYDVFMNNIDNSTKKIYNVTHNGSGHYLIDNIINGTITLYKNKKYEFNIDASGHPFMIKTELSTGTDNSYNTGIINNGTEFGK